MLLISDSTRLPDIYHRQADKSKHYISGSLGSMETIFNMQSWQQHAHYRKLIAGPVRDTLTLLEIIFQLHGLFPLLKNPHFLIRD